MLLISNNFTVNLCISVLLKVCTTLLEMRMSMQQKNDSFVAQWLDNIWSICYICNIKRKCYYSKTTITKLQHVLCDDIDGSAKVSFPVTKHSEKTRHGKCKIKIFIRCMNFAYVLQETKNQSFCGTFNILIRLTWQLLVIWKYSK